MFEIKVTIDAPDLSNAINALASAFTAKCTCTPENKTVIPNQPIATGQPVIPDQLTTAVPNPFGQPVQQISTVPPGSTAPPITTIPPVMQVPIQQGPIQQGPIQQGSIQQEPIQQEPIQQVSAVIPGTPPTGVPVAPATYTMEQLAVAATQLVDAGRRTDLVALLGQFGVPALTALPKEQYGAFATSLRQMGAQI